MTGGWFIIAISLVGHSVPGQSLCTVVDMNNSRQMISEKYTFGQPLDHFSPLDTNMLDQSFWEMCDLYEEGGPVFLSIGGLAPITEPWPKNSILEDLAKEHKALVFKLEHRYYGESKPRLDGGNSSYLELNNLKYLSSSQALMDLANFIQSMNEVHPLLRYQDKPPRWVVFGCFYGGSLATWLRSKYPHLVYAAVATSAPLLARQDSPEYIDEIAKTIEVRRKNCGTEIMLALYRLKQSVTLCDKKKENLPENKQTNIFLVLANQIVQLLKNETDMMTFCDLILNDTGESPEKRFIGSLERLGLDMTFACDYNYSLCYSDLNELPNTYCPKYRQFVYQQCTEFGHFEALGRKHGLLPFSSRQCKLLFGESFSEEFVINAIKRMNIIYGGVHIDPSRLISIHCSLDPWRTLGLMSTNNNDSQIITMQGVYQQCMDQPPPLSTDSLGIKANIEEISRILGQWLEESHQTPEDVQHSSASFTIPWLSILIGLFMGCIVVVVFVIFKFTKSSQTLHV